jgi:hypothetical protein
MAEYYHLIRRAVFTFDNRRAVYNHARAAQAEQLGKRPFNKKDFDRERSSFRQCVLGLKARFAVFGETDLAPTPGVRRSALGPDASMVNRSLTETSVSCVKQRRRS